MVYLALVTLVLVVAALGAWTARGGAPPTRSLPCSSDRLGTTRGL